VAVITKIYKPMTNTLRRAAGGGVLTSRADFGPPVLLGKVPGDRVRQYSTASHGFTNITHGLVIRGFAVSSFQ
jgi:hypothetical protein